MLITSNTISLGLLLSCRFDNCECEFLRGAVHRLLTGWRRLNGLSTTAAQLQAVDSALAQDNLDMGTLQKTMTGTA